MRMHPSEAERCNTTSASLWAPLGPQAPEKAGACQDSAGIGPVVGLRLRAKMSGARGEGRRGIPNPKGLSWSVNESLLVSKRSASCAVAVRVRSGLRSPECMATAGQMHRGAFGSAGSPPNCAA